MAEPILEIKQLIKEYGNNRVLDGVYLTVRQGEVIVIVGPSCCGKSTLLKTILGIVPIRNGDVAIDGASLKGMDRNDISRRIAYLSQGKRTPDMTVEQLVLHGRFPHLNYPRRYTKHDYEIAIDAMKQMGIAQYADKSLHTLSGGMRQNTYIAMALAQGTDYVLLDEPTTYLDIAHQLELMKILRSLADSGKGIVAVMHDLPMAFSFSDKIILINDGWIVDDDLPERIYEHNVIDEVFGIAIDRSKDGRSYSYKY